MAGKLGGRGFNERPAHLGTKKMSSAGSRVEKVPTREAFSAFCTSRTSTTFLSHGVLRGQKRSEE